jgi:hypothetical protein
MDQPRISLINVASAGILGISLIIGTLIAANAFYKSKALNNTISVTGSAEKIIESDTVKWVGSFSRQAEAADIKGGNDQIKADLKTVMDYIKSKGIDEKDVTFQTMIASPVCDSQNNVMYDKTGNQICAGNRVVGYSLQQGIIIESKDVQRVSGIAKDVATDLINQGVLFTSNNPEYYYSKLGDIKLEMLTEATKNAKERADKIIQSTGGKIGGLQNAGMGVFQVTPVNSTEISDYGTYDNTSIEKKVTAIVRTSFILN